MNQQSQEFINMIDFNLLSNRSLGEIYAASFGMCTHGDTEQATKNLRISLTYQREQGNVKFPKHPSERLLNELKSILNP